MPEVISCPSCGQKLRLPEGSTDKQVQCPACKAQFQAPLPAAFPDLELGSPSQGSAAAVEEPAPAIQASRIAREPVPRKRAWMEDNDAPIPKRPSFSLRHLSSAPPRKAWWLLGVVFGLAAAVLAGWAFFSRERAPDLGPKAALDKEFDEERRKEIMEAFRHQKPLAGDEIARELKPLFDSLGDALKRRDGVNVAAQFNVERMVDELEAQELLPKPC
jgi:hypothetical protein